MKMRGIMILAAAGAVACVPQAQARERVEVHPYIEVDQTVFADFKNGGGALTYTTLASGVSASVQTRRVEVQVDYRYDYRLGWNKGQGNSSTQSGVARAKYLVVPNLLSFEAGALATRVRGDIRGNANNPFIGDPSNTSQLYSAYIGPNLSTSLSGLQLLAGYRFGFTKVESRTTSLLTAGQPVLDSFDKSTTHVATASIGMPASSGTLPFGWTVSGGYEREDADQLDQRYEGKFGRGDVVVPVAPTIALVGGVGYEDIKATQRDALRDVNGVPVTDGNGRFVTDPASPRQISFETSGLIWDTGVVWRPSRRTMAEIRVGRRYGDMSYTGSISYQMNESLAFQAGLYDGIQTFGRQLNQSLSALPTQFTVARNPFGGALGGCVYSSNTGGGCLDAALQSVATGTYRSRGLNAVLTYSRGPMTWGLGGGYAQRKFFAPTSAFFSVNGVTDESYYLQAYATRQIDAASNVTASVYASMFDSGILGAPDVFGTGATAAYYRRFGNRFTGNVALGLYSSRIEDLESTLTGSALVGGRYEF
jgi:hypothetical protein